MRIGIFGGSFNPPHKMHISICLDLINKHYVDKIVFVPTGSKYKYKNNLLPDINRLEMLQIIVNNNNNLDVSDYEMKSKVVYTYQTLNYFKKINPDDEIYFICGTDNLSYMDKWMNGEEILSNYKILVIKRKGEDINELLDKFKVYKDNIVLTDIEQRDISSTDIRNKIQNKDSVLDLIDKDVLDYIKRNKLYE
ncbi:MAG: nicotinate (nicotinamide) nucleotide adenylyltransferase [Candidatus Coprovivens sp.]